MKIYDTVCELHSVHNNNGYFNFFQFQWALTEKKYVFNKELELLHSAGHLILLNICVKLHENISEIFQVTEQV